MQNTFTRLCKHLSQGWQNKKENLQNKKKIEKKILKKLKETQSLQPV